MLGNFLHLSDADFVDEFYQKWLENASSVEKEWAEFFEKTANNSLDSLIDGVHYSQVNPADELSNSFELQDNTAAYADRSEHRLYDSTSSDRSHINKTSHAYKQSRVNAMIWAYRDIGYLYADLNPLKGYITPDLWYKMFEVEGDYETLSLEEFGLSESDLDTLFLTGRFIPEELLPLRSIIERMQSIYQGRIGIEVLHIQNKAIRNWIITQIEAKFAQNVWSKQEKIAFQQDLIRAEELEHFIHSNFIGQKRFSLEGGETVIPVLRYLFNTMLNSGVEEVVLGMAHRGRLNVFINSMKKPAVDIFARFVDNHHHTYGGSGDVKYHLGFSADFTSTESDRVLHINLVANPSHLEAVNPVVEGKTRAIQRRRMDRHRKKAVPILIHGDSAFSGQGVVSETLNLSQLKGYRTGGTIHIIINNQIGFTTASRDSRSTFFATDIAKSISIPILHVNGDDPEAAIQAIDLALRFRQKFGRDVIVDIICYRRLGHNEADEPSFSHPKMYAFIKKHKSARHIYAQRLIQEGVWSDSEQKEFAKSYTFELKEHLKKARSGYVPRMDDAYQGRVWKNFEREYSFKTVNTAVEYERLEHIARVLVKKPENFQVHPKLERFTKGREKQFFETKTIDWAFAESLAFGSILMEGNPIRLSGEDCGRGTFSQRHVVWWDTESEVPKSYIPLHFLEDRAANNSAMGHTQGLFSVYDSPLSEFSVLGFDYGYSLATPHGLTIWEGQFGDFVNGAQVIIDQFIVAAEAKWYRSSGLVLLLPHGYEGQGPEHSSAFLERFLQLCSEDNIQVVNCTTPAQYFHVLRRQLKQKFRKPLIVMSPKSLLRKKECQSPIEELSESHFKNILSDSVDSTRVERILLCSGKIYYDLLEERSKRTIDTVAIVRVEQLYPFPAEELQNEIARFAGARQFYWVQEETENRGAWQYMQYRSGQFLAQNAKLEYVGRASSPSPATGSHAQHLKELGELLDKSFS